MTGPVPRLTDSIRIGITRGTTMINAQDKMLQDAIATMDADAKASPADKRIEARRATVAAMVVQGPSTGYAVEIAGHRIEVEAADFGDAVLKARDALKGTVANVGGYVFMWRFTVADSTGIVLNGEDRLMRESLQAARIRNQG